jgi:hypothetical protein
MILGNMPPPIESLSRYINLEKLELTDHLQAGKLGKENLK